MERPNILILMSDEHSFRFLGHRARYGDGEPVSTPTLDKLAEGGVYFERAYTAMPLCTPARMCFMTGRHAHRCGAWKNGSILDPSYPTLPGHFGSHGYETCLVGKMHFGGSLQFHGFNHRPFGDFGGKPSHQPDPIKVDGAGLSDNRTRTSLAGVTTIPESMLQEQIVARESISFLREHTAKNPSQPWLLCASFSRPHFPLTAPKRFLDRYWPDKATRPKVGPTGDTVDHPLTVAGRKGFDIDDISDEEMMKARAAYFACVEYLDEILGDFLGTLERDGLLDNTIIVYLSDHGEMAGEHGLWWKNFWHDASIRIPLIFKLPESMGATAGDRSDLANIIDVFPTLCGLAGLPIPDGLDGVDLRVGASDAGDSDEPRLVSQACHPRWGESTQFRVVTTRRYKYVHFRSAPELFFDLAEDPNEQKNLADRATGEAARVLTEARRIAQSVADWEEVDAKRIEDSKRLEALYPKRANAKGPNQFILPDGRMVEAETTLYKPVVVSKAPQVDFPDWPNHKS